VEDGRSALKMFTGKPTKRRPLGSWEDSIRIDIKEMGINVRNWINSTEGRDYWIIFVVYAALNFRVPLGAIHKLRHTNFMIFFTSPPSLSQVATFLRPPFYLV
jgi:hypothetical protein